MESSLKMTKKDVIAFLETMPDDATLDDIIYHLHVQWNILSGLQDVEEGRVISNEDMKEIIDQWSP